MFSKNTSMVVILLSLQMVHIKCINPQRETYRLQMELKKKFKYDVLNQDVANPVLVWKIASNPEKLERQNYRPQFSTFKTDETYLFLVKKANLKSMVHYWIGTRASLENKMVAAKYAVILFTLLHEYYNNRKPKNYMGYPLARMRIYISREQESLASESFQHTINLIEERKQPDDAYKKHPQYFDTQFLSKFPNLYVLKGKNNSYSYKKVPVALGLKWLSKNNTCVILETAYDVKELKPVTIICGAETSHQIQEAATQFGEQFQQVYNFVNFVTFKFHELYKHRDYKFKEIMEVLENSYYYKSYEVDNSNDHLKDVDEFINDRKKVISLFRISKQELRPVLRCIQNYIFGEKGLYILDTASAAGLFFIIGQKTDVKQRIAAIQIMEDYMDRSIPYSLIPTPMRITNGVNKLLPICFHENFFIDLLLNFYGWDDDYWRL